MRLLRISAEDLAAPSDQLQDWGPAREPLPGALATVRGVEPLCNPDVKIGIWECSPGRWRRQVMEPEFAYFLSGRCRFYPDQGEPFDILPGDAIFFPANTRGTWDISETLRKTYFVTGPFPYGGRWRARLRRLDARIRRRLAAWGGAAAPDPLPEAPVLATLRDDTSRLG